jgi:hypothetical protein
VFPMGFLLSFGGEGGGERKIFFIFPLFQQVSNVFPMGFLLSFGGEGGGEEDFFHFPFVPTGSQCIPHGCSQSHLALSFAQSPPILTYIGLPII